MFVVGEAVIDEAVAQARFACDLEQCRGACCTLPGGRGAPLIDEECAELERAFPAAAKYLSEEHLRVIRRDGLFEGVSGNFSTTCLNAAIASSFIMKATSPAVLLKKPG